MSTTISTMNSTGIISKRNYLEAINCLNSLQSNAATIEMIRKTGGKVGSTLDWEGIEYLKRIGYKQSDLNALNVIHITGTKGKGSTSAFTSNLLKTHSTTLSTSIKIGLFTSPHLVAVRERIRVNGTPIAEELFSKYFFQVWDRLENGLRSPGIEIPEKPAYFRYMTLMAFHVFLQEKVDATILEVGVGGTFDSTNIVPYPIVTGVTSLGIDHVFVLGKTLPEIANQKGGIYKAGVPALAVDQPLEGLDVLRSRATELKASSFTVIPPHPQLSTIRLGLSGIHQRINASLAIALVQAFLSSDRLPKVFEELSIPSPPTSSSSTSTIIMPVLDSSIVNPTPLSKITIKGLESTIWPGRCQVAPDVPNIAEGGKKNGLTWYLDGAHTIESLQCCGDWFSGVGFENPESIRCLIFNCTSGRSGLSLLGTLVTSLSHVSTTPFQHVIFCTNTTYSDGASKGDLTSNAVDKEALTLLTTQHELAEAWSTLQSTSSSAVSTAVHILPSIEDAVKLVRNLALEGEGKKVEVLVAGSLHLVGGVMAVAELPLDN